MDARLAVLCLLLVGGMLLPGSVGCGQNGLSGRGPEVNLPPPTTAGEMGVAEAIARRRTVRQFTGESLTIEQISQLAWAGQGITEAAKGLRAAPSAGALYPLELYLLTPKGVFRYIPQGQKLAQLSTEDKRLELSAAALGQESVREAPLVFVMTGVLARTEKKYGKRAAQYVYMEAGHAAENVLLQVVALGLAGGPIGAFREAGVSKVLRLSEGETPLYIVNVGHPREG